jgi:hypothetical protein
MGSAKLRRTSAERAGPAILALVVCAIAACAPERDPRRGEAGGGIPKPSVAPAPRVARRWPAAGVKRVVLRSSLAPQATVVVREGPSIEVSGRPSGGAAGYHPARPGWKETSAGDWGLDFVGSQAGEVLVISSRNEIRYIHHGYELTDLEVAVPPAVVVTREPRVLSGDGAPDLSPPGPGAAAGRRD